jgi:multiple sugar transport system substrate-binding protein
MKWFRAKPFYRWLPALAIVMMLAACAGASEPPPAEPEESGAEEGAAAEEAAPAETVTLSMWVHSNPHYQTMAEQFAAEYEQETGVKVEFDFLPWGDYGSKVVAAFAAGDEPDIMEAVASWLYAQKIAGDLDPVPADLAEGIEDRYHGPSLVPLEYDGTYYGIPLNVNIDAGPLFVANTSVFEEAGITPEWEDWDTYISDLQAVTQKEGDIVTRSGISVAGGDLTAQFLMYFLQAGGTFYDDTNHVTINNEYGARALQTMYDFVHTYEVDSTDLSDFTGVATGTSAGIFYGTWYTKVLDDDFPDVGWTWGKPALMPDAAGPYFASTNVWAWVVSANSPNKEVAWDYIRWLDENERRLAWGLETGEIPAVPAMWEDIAAADSERFGPWLPYLEYQVPVLHIGPQDEYYSSLENMVNSVLFEEATIEEALAQAEESINAMIDRVNE